MANPSSIVLTMAKERTRLQKAVQTATKRRDDIVKEIAELEQELKAVNAYYAAKGDATRRSVAARSARPARKTSGRRSGIREQVLDKVKEAVDGISRGDLLNVLSLKGNKSGEMAVSNALAALKRGGKLLAKDGKYLIGAQS
jgi:hypothetical protein